MTVYAQRRRGKLTGQWVVEVTRNGRRRRKVLPTFEQALSIEGRLLAGLEVVQDDLGTTYTLEWLRQQSSLIWEGCKDTQAARRFSVCVDLLGPKIALRDLRTLHIDELKAKLHDLKPAKRNLRPVVSPQTVHRYLSSLSAALRWAYKRELIAKMPYIPWPKLERPRKKYFRPEEEAAIVRYFLSRGNVTMAIVVRVLAVTGLRIGEFLKLQPHHIQDGFILVGDWQGGTKTGDTRYVPLDERFEEPLKQLLAQGLPSYRGILKYLKRATKACGIDPGKTPHKLRHTTATRLTQAGAQTFVIQELMGHRNVETTRGYVSVEPMTLKLATQLKGAAGSLEGQEGLSEAVLEKTELASIKDHL